METTGNAVEVLDMPDEVGGSLIVRTATKRKRATRPPQAKCSKCGAIFKGPRRNVSLGSHIYQKHTRSKAAPAKKAPSFSDKVAAAIADLEGVIHLIQAFKGLSPAARTMVRTAINE